MSGKKGSGKKSSKKKRAKGFLIEMTWKEAVLAYQINLKEKSLEDTSYELAVLESQSVRNKERNEKLKEEQKALMSRLLKANREMEAKMDASDYIDKDMVIVQMQQNWQTKRNNEQQLVELKERVQDVESEIAACRRDVSVWIDYRDRAQNEYTTQIKVLEQELVDMQAQFKEMKGQRERAMAKTMEEIEKSTNEIIDKQKYQATEKAIAKMDKYARREVIDNDWLTRQSDVHRKETNELFREVAKLEEENLTILNTLFEVQVEDLKISKNIFMTQFTDNDDLNDRGLLEMDLARVKFERPKSGLSFTDRESIGKAVIPYDKRSNYTNLSVRDTGQDGRLSSLSGFGVELRVDLKTSGEPDEYNDGEPEEEEEELEDDGQLGDPVKFYADNGPERSADNFPFPEQHNFDQDTFQDYLNLGPLELKLLNIRGDKLSILKPDTPPLSELLAKQSRPDDWPVTHSMLMNILGTSARPVHNSTPNETSTSKRTPRLPVRV